MSTQPPQPGKDTPAEHLAPVTFLPWAAPAATPEPAERSWAQIGSDDDRWTDSVTAVGDADENGDSDEGDDEESEGVGFDDAERSRVDRLILRSLARRGLSEREVLDLLKQNEVPAEEHEEWIARLVRLGYVDDAALADQLVRKLHERKGLGASSIAQELKMRKLDPIVISEALDALDSGEEAGRATEIALKRVGQLSSYDDATAERRLTGFLMRKGYPGGIVRAAVTTALATRKRGGVRFR